MEGATRAGLDTARVVPSASIQRQDYACRPCLVNALLGAPPAPLLRAPVFARQNKVEHSPVDDTCSDTFGQTDQEEMLAYEVSDEALEAITDAGGGGPTYQVLIFTC
jgi:hypothetical protein